MKNWDPDDWAILLVASIFPIFALGLMTLAIIGALS